MSRAPFSTLHSFLMFISFEGIDGCGKTTQLQLLAKRLEAARHIICLTREPGGTSLAEAIRDYLLHSPDKLEPQAELLLFGASRAAHVSQVIRPALERGEVVLTDRFADSSVAYQGGGLKLDADFIRAMNGFATTWLHPDVTFLLDIEPDAAQARRASEKEDRIEARGLEFQTQVREAYLEIARLDPARVVVLDARQSVEALHVHIIGVLEERGQRL